jgi:hypothetical protein
MPSVTKEFEVLQPVVALVSVDVVNVIPIRDGAVSRFPNLTMEANAG